MNKEAKQPDQLLNHALITLEMDLEKLRDEADIGLEPERSRILTAHIKVLIDMNRELRQTIKELDVKKLSTDELREAMQKIDEELNKGKK